VKISFKKVTFAFLDGTLFSIEKIDHGETEGLVAKIKKGKSKVDSFHIQTSFGSETEIRDSLRIPIHSIEDIIPSLSQVGPREWFDAETGEVLSLQEVVMKYSEELPISSKLASPLPERLEKILRQLPVYFIQTQRLLSEHTFDPQNYRARRPSRFKSRSVVELWSAEMASKIQEKLEESGALAASLDRQFPSTLLRAELPGEANEDRIREIYSEQTDYRNRLMRAGLMKEEEPVDLPPGQIDQSELKVLWFYFRDVTQKFAVFEVLLPKIELFQEIINSRFLLKTFSVDREQGFKFQNGRGDSIPATALSSGEQHELVLAYELLFKVKEGSLILIDEPELSLHVTWQHKFLEDITRISELVDLDFLIATHSPAIIYNRSDLMVELK
jgi:hypothetical protein